MVTQYSADSFAQPLRRVFGGYAFRAREEVHMPLPGNGNPARLTVHMYDLVWEGLYLPIVRLINVLAEKLNHLQFLTIRRSEEHTSELQSLMRNSYAVFCLKKKKKEKK